jgi:endonuclease/exonuclease/phosphatase family metal-dependent hydrolase
VQESKTGLTTHCGLPYNPSDTAKCRQLEETDPGQTLEFIQAAAVTDSCSPLILLGDFNVNLQQMMNGNVRQQETAALISSLGLYDLHQHFSQRHGWGNWTWSQDREGSRIKSVCDYILVENRDDFQSFQIKQP